MWKRADVVVDGGSVGAVQSMALGNQTEGIYYKTDGTALVIRGGYWYSRGIVRDQHEGHDPLDAQEHWETLVAPWIDVIEELEGSSCAQKVWTF